jgi:hypothetical protein
MLKPKRIENKALKAEFYSKKCLVCNRIGSDPAHIKTVGSGGNDSENNIIPLCREHQTEQHKIGIGTFSMKYSTVEAYLNRFGWEIITMNGINKIRRINGI